MEAKDDKEAQDYIMAELARGHAEIEEAKHEVHKEAPEDASQPTNIFKRTAAKIKNKATELVKNYSGLAKAAVKSLGIIVTLQLSRLAIQNFT